MRLPEFARFLSVGALNTLAGLVVIFAAKALLGAGDVLANVTGYAVGMVLSFTLNSRWTFEYRGAQLPAFLRFVAVMLLAYLANLFTVLAAIHLASLNSYLAQALGVPAFTLTSYVLSKFLVFRSRH